MSNESTLTFRINVEGADDAARSFQSVGAAAQQMGSETSSAAGGIGDVGSAAKTAATDTKGFGTSMATLGFGIASAASSVIGLVRSFENISRAQDKATSTNTKLERSNLAVAKAQDAYNQAVAKYGINSSQAEQAATKLDIAFKTQADAANRAANAAENVGFAWANAATDAIQFGAGIGSIVSSIGTAKTAFSGLKDKLGGLGSGFTQAGTAGGTLTGTLGKVAASAGLMAGALTVAIVAADELSKVRMGDPNFAAQVEKDTQALQKFSLASEAVKQLGPTFSSIGPIITKALSGIPATISGFLGGLPAQIGGFFAGIPATISGFLSGLPAQIGGVFARIPAAIGSVLGGLGGQIGSFFAGIPGKISTILGGLPGQIGSFFAGIPGAISGFLAGLPQQIAGFFAGIPAAITGFLGGLPQRIAGFFAGIPGTISGALAGIPGTISTALGGLANSIATFFSGIPGKIGAALAGIPAQISNAFANLKWPQLPPIPIPTIPDIVNTIKQKFAGFTWPTLPPIPIPSIPDIVATIKAKFAGFTWPALPSIPIPTIPDIISAIKSKFAGFTWPTLPAIPLPTLPNIVGAIKSAFSGFGWPALPAIPMPKLPDIASGLKNLLSGFTWPALPALKAPDTSLVANAIKAVTDSPSWKKLFGGGGAGRHGLAQVVSSPSNIRVGEGFHPELVTVIPLGGGAGTSGSVGARKGGTFMTGAGGGFKTAPPGFSLHAQGGIFAVAMAQFQEALAAWSKKIAELASMISATNTVSGSLTSLAGTVSAPRWSQTLKNQVSNRRGQAITIGTKAQRDLAMAQAQKPVAPQPPSLSHRRGGNVLVDRPTNLQIGEGFKPEIVNVIPLTGPHAPPEATKAMGTIAFQEQEKIKEDVSKKESKASKRATGLHAQGGGTFAFGLDKLFAGTTPKGGTATATAAVSMQLEDKDTFQQDTQELGKAFGTTIPKEWNTEVTADTSGANASVTAYGRSIQSIPKEKETEIDADDRGATQAISSVNRALDTLPANKNIKITITSPAGASGTLSFRHGGTSIISHPTNIHVGEGFHPELVSVVPLGKVPHAQGGGNFLITPRAEKREKTEEAAGAEQAANSETGELMDWMTGPVEEMTASQQERSNLIDQAYTAFEEPWANIDTLYKQLIWDVDTAAKGKHNLAVTRQLIPAIDTMIETFGPVMETMNSVIEQTGIDITNTQAEIERLMAALEAANLMLQDFAAEQHNYQKEIADLQSGPAAEGGISDYVSYKGEWQVYEGELLDWITRQEKIEKNAKPAARGFGPSLVNEPTMFLAGEAGPEMVEVTPLRNGTRARAGGGGGSNMARIEALLEKLIRKSGGGGGMEANLVVDGQRMASVAEKYIGTKSYGAR